MKEIIIKESDANIKIKKYLVKLLPSCNTNLLYKLIRKKYFTLNNVKIKGDEVLKKGDIISIFLSNETYDSFNNKNTVNVDNINVDIDDVKNRIIYEDDNIIVFNKKEGELSQKSDGNSISINEKINYYLYNTGFHLSIYKPSVVNRLDINTKGLIIFSKTYIASNIISKLLKNKMIKKYYFTYVNGIIKKKKDILYGEYNKNEKTNKAYITLIKDLDNENDNIVITEYELIKNFYDYAAVNINLITGKSHQIRAHFSSINHPLICDKKYMNNDLYNKNKKRFNRHCQDLICYKIVFPKDNELDKIGLSEKEFKINYGDINKYEKI